MTVESEAALLDRDVSCLEIEKRFYGGLLQVLGIVRMRLVGGSIGINSEVEFGLPHVEFTQQNARAQESQDADTYPQALHLRIRRFPRVFEAMNHDSAGFGFKVRQPPMERLDLYAPARRRSQLCEDLASHQVLKLAGVEPEAQCREDGDHRDQQSRAVPEKTPPLPRRRGLYGVLLHLAHSTSPLPFDDCSPGSRLASSTSTSPCLRRLSSQLSNITVTCSSRRISSMRAATALSGGIWEPFGYCGNSLSR